MTRQELINKLNNDLANEYKHMLFYLFASIRVKGLHRSELSELFSKEASSEMGHVQEFSNMILGLGGIPNNSIQFSTMGLPGLVSTGEPSALIEYSYQIEMEVIDNYVERMQEVENTDLSETDKRWVIVFLEEQLLHSRTDADNFRQML